MSLVGLIIPLAGIQQVMRLIKRKTSGDLSLILYFAIVFCQLNWLYYGFSILSICIIFSNSASLLVAGTVLFLCLKYRRNL